MKAPVQRSVGPLSANRALLFGGVLVTSIAVLRVLPQGHAAETAHRASHKRAQVSLRHLAFVANNASDFWTVTQRGAEQAQHDLKGVKVDFYRPAEGTAEEQATIMGELTKKGAQGIAVSPTDPENETSLLNEVAAHTNLITVDSDAPHSKRRCYVGTDNYAAGIMAGRLMKQAAPNGGKIMLFVGKLDAINAMQRQRGILDALRGSRLRVIGTLTDDTDRLRAKNNAATSLVKYPNLVGMMGLWSYNGPMILSAVRAAHKTGKVKIVCFDEEDDTLNGVKSGGIYATVVQNPYEFGYQSIKVLDQLSRGDKKGIPANKQIIIPTRAIRRGNVAAFQQQLNQWRGR